MQQCLPFTVLKLVQLPLSIELGLLAVATVLTVYGIETLTNRHHYHWINYQVATVLTVYGIETEIMKELAEEDAKVATVLTVYGIETH